MTAIAAAFSVVLLAGQLPLSAQELTAQEKGLLNSCAENLTRKIYSPVKAEECLLSLAENDHRLLNKARAVSDIQNSQLMAGLNAIKDLGEFYRDAEAEDIIYQGLLVRFKTDPCVLCGLELGPQPDKLYPWVSRYAPGKLAITKKATLDWAGLPAPAPAQLTERGQSQGTWAGMTIDQRRKTLEDWAAAKYDEILPPGTRNYDAEKYFPTVLAIWPYITEQQRLRLNAARKGMNEALLSAKSAAAAGGGKTGELGRKYDALDQKLQGLSGNPDSAAGFLNKAFDNSVSGSGVPDGKAGEIPGPVYTLTDEQAIKLSPRVRQALVGPGGELSDTAMGKEALAFLSAPGGQLKFSVVKLGGDNTSGEFSGSVSREVRINRTYVETAMRKTGVTTAELMDENNREALKKIARYVAPTFVHEYCGHQKQAVWAESKNIPDLYYLGQETEAFSKSALFVLQKTQAEMKKGNPWYSQQTAESYVGMARVLKTEGQAGISRAVMYYQVPSREGKAAQTFAQYDALKKELALRETGTGTGAARYRDTSDWELERQYKAIYPWYKESLKKSAEEKKYFQDALDALDREMNGSLGKSPVPDL